MKDKKYYEYKGKLREVVIKKLGGKNEKQWCKNTWNEEGNRG